MTEKKQRPLGSAQIYVLRMVNPEWPSKYPDSRSVRVLHSLAARGLTYENHGRWYISDKGRVELAAHVDSTRQSEEPLVLQQLSGAPVRGGPTIARCWGTSRWNDR